MEDSDFTFKGQRPDETVKHIVRRASFSDRQILVVEDSDLINELAGSLKMPKEWHGKNLDRVIESAKDEYFKKQ